MYVKTDTSIQNKKPSFDISSYFLSPKNGKIRKKIMSFFTLFTYILIGDEQDFEFLL